MTSSKEAQAAEDASDSKAEGPSRRKKKKKAAAPVQAPQGRRGRRGKKSRVATPSALQQAFEKPAAPVERDVKIGETISVAELANKMAVKATEVIKVMMKMAQWRLLTKLLTRKQQQSLPKKWVIKLLLLKKMNWKKRYWQKRRRWC